MIRKFSGVAKAAASISLAGGILVMAALPAAAASPNDAYAVSAGGVLTVSPIGEATFPGTSPVTLLNADVTGLLTTGAVTDTATATTASSTIANAGVTVSALASIAATTLSSSCALNTTTGAVSGSAKLVDATISLNGVSLVTLDANPTRNETVTLPAALSSLLSITLNKHTTTADGTLTVDAAYITILGTGQTLILASSTCNAASLAPVPVLPTKTLAFSLTGLGVLLLGGLGYQVSRRRRQGAAAA
jgi:hypothetical protein